HVPAFTDDMKRVVEEQRLGFVATVCPDGTPNLSPKGTTAVWDDERPRTRFANGGNGILSRFETPVRAPAAAICTTREPDLHVLTGGTTPRGCYGRAGSAQLAQEASDEKEERTVAGRGRSVRRGVCRVHGRPGEAEAHGPDPSTRRAPGHDPGRPVRARGLQQRRLRHPWLPHRQSIRRRRVAAARSGGDAARRRAA